MSEAGKTYAELGRKLGQRTAAGAASWLRGQDLGVGMDRLSDPYRRSAWVRGAIKLIAGPVAAVSLEFYAASAIAQKRRRHRSTDDKLEIPALESFLREPMRGYSWSDCVEASVGWLKMAGEFFWLLPDEALLPYPQASKSLQVVMARPDRMRHVVHAGKLEGWRFIDGSGRNWDLLPDQVVHCRQWNPYDDWRGLGDYEAAMLAAEGDYLAAKFARNLASNNGDTGPYIVAKGGIPDDGQRDQIIADLRAKRFAQSRGDFRPVFLSGDITVEDPKIKTVDAAYISGRIENRHEVYVAFGVPPSLGDVKAAYSIGSASDNFQLIFNTCMPTGKKLCGAVDLVAARLAGVTVESELNWDEHPVMQEVRKERLVSVSGLWSMGVPMSVIDEYLDLGLPDYEGKDQGYLPFSVAPVGMELDPGTDPALGEVGAVDPVQDAVKALRNDGGLRRARPTHECGCSIDAIDMRGRDPKEIAQWKELMIARRATIKAYRSKFDQVLMRARREVLAKIEARKSAGATAVRAGAAADFLFNIANFAGDFRALMRGVSLQAVNEAGSQFYKEIQRDDPWKAPSAETIRFLEERENKLAGVPNEVFGRVRKAIQEKLDEGGTLDEVAAAVKGEFNKISDQRGRTIAQTETGAAYGFGRQKSMESAGIKFKRWLTSGNSNVRSAHRAMNGAVVGIDESFLVINPDTGESDSVKHPGDADGSAWNVINCHCVSVASKTGPDDVEPAE